MRVLVCGGRAYSDRDHIWNTLCEIDAARGPITCVIHGAATGADSEAMIWAQTPRISGRKILHAPFVADWRTHGKAAGPLRNQRMIEQGKPDLVVAFPGGRGTADCVSRARAAGIEVIEITAKEKQMSVDKRSVKTDALETLGFTIDENQKRDAIHIAVEPVLAAQILRPGQDVGFVEGGVGPCDNPVGIVDPFLKVQVNKGQHFWLLVYPRQITSLRHVWTHPAFPEASLDATGSNKTESEAWLRNFIDSANCPGYEEVIAAAVNNGDSWDSQYLHFNGSDAHGEIPPEFWRHVEIVTGRTIPHSARASYFSCSC